MAGPGVSDFLQFAVWFANEADGAHGSQPRSLAVPGLGSKALALGEHLGCRMMLLRH